MEVSEKQLSRLRVLLGENLLNADTRIYTSVYVCVLRCVFRESPDPEILRKFTFTDSQINLMERLHVPSDVIESIRKTRNIFFNEEMGLYGVALNLHTMIDIIGPRDEADDGESVT